VWTNRSEMGEGFLAQQGYDDPKAVQDSLERLRSSFSFRALSARGHERLDQLMPLVLGAAARAERPARTLERIARLIEAIARRSVYLAMLVENPMALSQLVKLCDASSWIADYLARYPLLLDELLDPASLYVPLDCQALDRELKRMLDRVPADDTEQVMDVLRHFQHTNSLRVAAAEVSGAMPLMVVSDYLTEIAEVVLRRVLELAWKDLTVRHGRPRCEVDGQQRLPQMAIVAYGKLGGIELGYGSDLDLVFLHDSEGEKQQTDGDRVLDNSTFFVRLGQRIIHFLSTRTPAGQLYEVDTRLRPSGKSGLLVSSLSAFAEYQRHQAWTWEHQALVRARVVAGPDALRERFTALRREVLSRQRELAELRRQVREMRERMRKELGSSKPGYFNLKQDRGGIADIEFMVQYAVLANAHRYPELLNYTDNIRQIAGLELSGVLSSSDAGVLRDAYRDLRRRAHRLKLQAQSSLVPREEVGEWPKAVARLWWQLLEKD
ncbi:MAG: bifunctional [glutamate--ammonia ligase]-adenylyl-L-tyrosine phosphorylase/[glutamate--ammonia-ligase] adenylyltransferase, partial [Candidatus Competibacteraceae bacterium]|nr:bifunctional [glutamate--ammonia ligase]-adenylyl-L-tyrosine phosphorylase/[glutamate--ammonia-ligase] adenylyltransferase [Candidatus Competibacteraceae bacterium]